MSKDLDPSLYCLQMQEIINRDALLRDMISGKKSLGAENYDYEVFSLNMRKILELIAFSSLISCKEEYASVHKNFDDHYKSKAILKELEKINPRFFPVPAALTPKQADGTRTLSPSPLSVNALTRAEFEELYDKCSEVIHAWKPYSAKEKKVDFRISPLEWLNKVRDLLNTHYIHLPGNKHVWLCIMIDSSDNKPHVYTLEAVD